MDQRYEWMRAWQRRQRIGMATQVLDLPFATVVMTDDLPAVWDQNLMVVTSRVPAPLLLRSADRVADSAGWRHRRIEVDDHAIAATLADPLRAAGYTEQRFVTMVLTGAWSRDAESDGRATDIVAVDEHSGLTRALLAEQPWADTDGLIEQFVRREHRLAAVADARAVVAPPDAPVGRCLLLTDGALFEVDAVETLTAHRGRGIAAAVLRRAVDEAVTAGAEVVALTADEGDWTLGWYERSGFEIVGRTHVFQRAPSS